MYAKVCMPTKYVKLYDIKVCAPIIIANDMKEEVHIAHEILV